MRSPSHLLPLVAVLVMALPEPAAHADSFAELVIGPVLAVADSEYSGLMQVSPKYGVRFGYLSNQRRQRLRYGGELAFDYTDFRDEYVDPSAAQTQDFFRIRVELGARAYYELKPDFFWFGRALVGLDEFSTETVGTAVGIDFHDTDVDLGFAIEVGTGVMWNMDDWSVGGQLAVPVAFQAGDGKRDTSAFDADFMSIDIDLLLTVGLKL